MSAFLDSREEARENQSLMMIQMEQKLNPLSYAFFKYSFKRERQISAVSVAQYWDILTYIDDDYLTDFEVLKMKELYRWQLQELSG